MCQALEWGYRKKQQYLSQEAPGLGVHVRPDEEVSTGGTGKEGEKTMNTLNNNSNKKK